MAGQAEKTLMTAEELLRLPDDGFRYELVKGELVGMVPTGWEHGVIANRLGLLLGQHVYTHHLGAVAVEAGYCLGCRPDTVRAPDVSFVAQEHIPDTGGPKGFWKGAPDLAVEVISPSDTMDEVLTKVTDYLNAGTRLVWVVHPATKTVTEYRSLAQVRVLTADETLEGRDVVPGFKCRVGDLF
ncbi:MAG: Uma2 family endonuclease [Anaerolineae bacterium]